jgi:pantetheine-phosphate adenylyltransferase
MVRAVFPGTFDPIHYGHMDIAHRASRLFDELLVAVYDRPLKNLIFSPEERINLVQNAFSQDANIKVVGYQGLTIEFCRQMDAQVIVRGLRVFSDFEHEFRMALANHRLDPGIDVIALITSEEHTFLSSTTVREIACLGGDISSMVPPKVAVALRQRYQDLGEERQFVPISSLRD